MSYSVYQNFDTVRQELSLKCPTLILMTTREDFDASVEAFDLKIKCALKGTLILFVPNVSQLIVS
jgi:hypothetical protein